MKKQKTIAYLIQAHHQENNFYDLIKKLNNKEVCFFVHIDKKSNQAPFEEKVKKFDNVFFVKNRVNVIWKGYSQVQATLNTIEISLDSNFEFKYFNLLSGVCYPIKSNNDILDFLKKTNKNYINFIEIKESTSGKDYFSGKQFWFKFSKWHFYETFQINWNTTRGSIKHQFYRVYILLNIFVLNLFLKNKKLPTNIKKYYFGSSWWNLNAETVHYVYDFLKNKKNKEFKKLFYYSDAPDEMVFQTIILNSSYKKDCVDDHLRFIDWDRTRESPAVLDEGDFDAIKESKSFFCRKNDFKKSKKLKTKIDKELL